MAKYYLAVDNERKGPFSEEDLLKNGMTPNSLVWCKGMEGWTQASEVPELARYFDSQSELPPIPQHPYAQFGQSQHHQYDDIPPRPNNYLAWSIVVTILCFWPFGIPAIVNAAKVNSLYDRGEYDRAERASRNAKNWTIASAVTALAVVIIYILIIAVAAS